MAFVKPDFDYTTSSLAFGTILTKKKKKSLYTSKRNAEFDPNDISVFEEVVKMPPFKRKSLVLIGAQVRERGPPKKGVAFCVKYKSSTRIWMSGTHSMAHRMGGVGGWASDVPRGKVEFWTGSFVPFLLYLTPLKASLLDSAAISSIARFG